MPTSLSATDIANIALQKIGAYAIASLTDGTNPSAVACNTALPLAILSVARETRWNCLMATALLDQIFQTPLPPPPDLGGGLPNPPPNPPNWAPHTAYAANFWLQFGGYLYYTAFAYTSSTNFVDDLTNGSLIQSNAVSGTLFSGVLPAGSQFASGWAYGYQLPADFVSLVSMNGQAVNMDVIGGNTGTDYEIIGANIYCDAAQAVIQYVQTTDDTTRFDALFTDALTYKLAAMVATTIRQDGGKLQMGLLQAYRAIISMARTKNGGEKQSKRFNPISSSKFNQARYGGVNG